VRCEGCKGSHQTPLHFVTLANVHCIRKKIWSPECAKSRLQASAAILIFSRGNTQTPLKVEGRGEVRQGNGREGRSRDGTGKEGTGRKGTGVPLSQILDTPSTVQLIPDRGCGTAYECRVMLQLPPAQSMPQARNKCELSGVYYTLHNPATPG
jgi:hypothetical protein